MQRVAFGRTGREVSRLCFGAMGLNCAFGRYERRDLVRAVHAAMDRGIDMFDTARTYGESEEILGLALRERSGSAPFVATKVAPAPGPTHNGWGLPNPVDVAYPPGAIRQSAEASLRALGVERIDLLQLHQYWPVYGDDGRWLDELEALREEGKVAHIGVSITDHRHDGAIGLVRTGRIDSVQTILNIFDPLALDCLAPLCAEHGVAVIARCVLDEGGLAGGLRAGSTFPADDFRADYFTHGPLDEYVRRVERLRAFVPAHAPSLAALAIRFALHDRRVTTATISMHLPEQMAENVEALGAGLAEDVFHTLRTRHRWLHNLYEAKYFAEGASATGFKSHEHVEA